MTYQEWLDKFASIIEKYKTDCYMCLVLQGANVKPECWAQKKLPDYPEYSVRLLASIQDVEDRQCLPFHWALLKGKGTDNQKRAAWLRAGANPEDLV